MVERCDFSAVAQILLNHLDEIHAIGQMDFMYLLFQSFIESGEAFDFDFTESSVCRALKGYINLSPELRRYYDDAHLPALSADIVRNLFSKMYDSAKAAEELHRLVLLAPNLSEVKKQELSALYSRNSELNWPDFTAAVLHAAMHCKFVSRKPDKKALSDGSRSIAVQDYILGNTVPKPEPFFCGRDAELEELHRLLTSHGKVFVNGIPGIGKSELVKAYAHVHRDDYASILYINYSGDLRQDIIDLDFIDDPYAESNEARFSRHSRFLKLLSSDSLLIIDNLNATEDELLPELLTYSCRVLISTRCIFEDQPTMQLKEIEDKAAIFEIIRFFYPQADRERAAIEKVIEYVHRHTMSILLICHLLKKGVLDPIALLRRLETERFFSSLADRIRFHKDRDSARRTYSGHIRFLFALFKLSLPQQEIMRNLTLIPLSGIQSRRFARWLRLDSQNDIHDLIELGLVQQGDGHRISLHPLIHEVALVETPPSNSRCRTLIASLHEIFLCRGLDLPYHKLLFRVVEMIMVLAEKDDLTPYLRFLEDSFAYMGKYEYAYGMYFVLEELERLLRDEAVGDLRDRALLLECHAEYAGIVWKNDEQAVELETQALSLLGPITPDTALLAANIHANLGTSLHRLGRLDEAQSHMEQGLTLLHEHHLLNSNDGMIQTCNYAVLLSELGQVEKGLRVLEQCAALLAPDSGDYACVQEAMGDLYLSQQDFMKAGRCYQMAWRIYQDIWIDEPELLEARRAELAQSLGSAGMERFALIGY